MSPDISNTTLKMGYSYGSGDAVAERFAVISTPRVAECRASSMPD